MKKDIHVAHSPDSDDAFMFYAMATRKIDTGDLNYIHTLSDIETFDKILDEVQKGNYDAGLLIHEGQLTYRELGLHKVIDLGQWWLKQTGLPLPLGGNVIKRDLGHKLMERIGQDIRSSIQYGLDHREEAMAYAIQFSRGLDTQDVDRFIGMYVNELTLDYGTEGRQAVRKLLQEAYRKKIIPEKVVVEFV